MKQLQAKEFEDMLGKETIYAPFNTRLEQELRRLTGMIRCQRRTHPLSGPTTVNLSVNDWPRMTFLWHWPGKTVNENAVSRK